MTSTCQYCNSTFRGARSTKKYCNDNCRQMAYLSRRGFTAVDGVDDVKPAFSADSVKYDTNVNYDVKTPAPAVKYDKMEDQNFELLFNRLSAFIENKIDALRKDLNVKHTTNDSVEAVKLCTPCNVNFTSKLNPPVINGTEEPGLCNEEEEPEEEEPQNEELEIAQQRISELEQQLLETKRQLVQKLTADAEAQLAAQEEPIEEETEEALEEEESIVEEIEEPVTDNEPQAVNVPAKFDVGGIPRLHLHIERFLEDGQHGYVFNNPLRHWPESDVKNILWVNVRLRCLLVSLVRMTNFARVDKESFTMLANGFIALYNSKAFQSLPADYPYMNLFIELTDWLRNSALKQGNRNHIRVILTIKRKALIVAICHELAENTEIVKFSELGFEPLGTSKFRNKEYYKTAA